MIQLQICPGCGYERQESDTASSVICPKCNQFYHKAEPVDLAKMQAEKEARLLEEKNSLSQVSEEEPLVEKLSLWAKLNEPVLEYCQKRTPILGILFTLYFGSVLFRRIFSSRKDDVFSGICLGTHEWGHFIFAPFGEFMTTLGGTLAEIMCPLICLGILLVKQKELYAIPFCFAWLASSMFSVGIYMSDARALQLNLVTPGGRGSGLDKEDVHDWHGIFSSMNLINLDTLIGGFTCFMSIFILTIAVVMSAYFTWVSLRHFSLKNLTS